MHFLSRYLIKTDMSSWKQERKPNATLWLTGRHTKISHDERKRCVHTFLSAPLSNIVSFFSFWLPVTTTVREGADMTKKEEWDPRNCVLKKDCQFEVSHCFFLGKRSSKNILPGKIIREEHKHTVLTTTERVPFLFIYYFWTHFFPSREFFKEPSNRGWQRKYGKITCWVLCVCWWAHDEMKRAVWTLLLEIQKVMSWFFHTRKNNSESTMEQK